MTESIRNQTPQPSGATPDKSGPFSDPIAKSIQPPFYPGLEFLSDDPVEELGPLVPQDLIRLVSQSFHGNHDQSSRILEHLSEYGRPDLDTAARYVAYAAVAARQNCRNGAHDFLYDLARLLEIFDPLIDEMVEAGPAGFTTDLIEPYLNEFINQAMVSASRQLDHQRMHAIEIVEGRRLGTPHVSPYATVHNHTSELTHIHVLAEAFDGRAPRAASGGDSFERDPELLPILDALCALMLDGQILRLEAS